MKKSLLILSLVSVCGFSVCAGAFPEHPTFQQVRNATLSPEKAQSVKSARIIFSVKGEKAKGYLMLRAKRPDQVRLDLLKGKEYFCAVRNRNDFWLYNAKEGFVAMSPAEAAGFEQYISFLSIPFYSKQIFTDPVFLQSEVVNGKQRSVFETKAQNLSGGVCTMHVDNETKLLRKTKKTDKNDKVGYMVLYRDYETIAGVPMPRHISVSWVNTNIKMNLITADWNLDLDDTMFQKNKEVKDHDVTLLLNRQDTEENRKQVRRNEAESRATVAKLESRIRQLKLQIADDEKTLEQMEDIMKSDRDNSVSLSMSSGNSSHYYWRGDCWRSRSSGDRTQRSASRRLEKELKTVAREYRDLRDKILRERTELGDLEYRLKQFQK